ncbi:hypothetical protein [Kocuria sp. TGY1127_2]|uniref:hypothetical protein n=1 Tax=Kocuria sp. TGY1127_2 TaxID=2711328 RepID=UPI0015C039E3|nr:hypothetical protein [Kocuria sp. TGY1127_2]
MFDYLPDGEQALIEKLSAAHPDLIISTREPAAPATAWVRLFRITGDDRLYGVTGTETYAIESWHKNRESLASKTAMDLRTTILTWGFNRGQKLTNDEHTALIRSTGASMPINLPDPDGRTRYTFNANLVLRHP